MDRQKPMGGSRVLKFALIILYSCYVVIKGKVIPLQAWAGPDGSRRLRIPDFKTIGT
jgi:hypothetical protein